MGKIKAALVAAWKQLPATVRTRARDIAARAGHTAWQAFAAALAVTWAASGLNVAQVTDIDSAKRFGLAALGAVLAAAASAAKTTVAAVIADAKVQTVAAVVPATTPTPATPPPAA